MEDTTADMPISFDRIMRQSWAEVEDAYTAIERFLDKRHGVGYAKKNPELMGTLVAGAMNNSAIGVLAKVQTERLEQIGQNLDALADATAAIADNIGSALGAQGYNISNNSVLRRDAA